MVRKCIVCGLTYSADKSASFHSFPTNEKLKKLWLDACNITNISKQAKICSRHFSTSCFKTWGNNKHRTLEKNAVPVLFLGKENRYLKRVQKHSLSSSIIQSDLAFPSTSYNENNTMELVQDVIQKQIKSGTQNLSSTSFMTTDVSITDALNRNILDDNNQQKETIKCIPLRKSISVFKKIWRPARIGDCKEEHFSTPRCAKLCFDLVVRKLSKHKKRSEVFRKQIRRLKSKVQTLQNLISKLQDEQLISENVAQILLVYISRIFNTRHFSISSS